MEALELDIATVNDFELKGILLSLIGKAKRKQLIRLFEVLKTDVSTMGVEGVFEDDAEDPEIFWGRFTLEQRAELEQSFEDSYNPENWIAHEDMLKKHAKWLKK